MHYEGPLWPTEYWRAMAWQSWTLNVSCVWKSFPGAERWWGWLAVRVVSVPFLHMDYPLVFLCVLSEEFWCVLCHVFLFWDEWPLCDTYWPFGVVVSCPTWKLSSICVIHKNATKTKCPLDKEGEILSQHAAWILECQSWTFSGMLLGTPAWDKRHG